MGNTFLLYLTENTKMKLKVISLIDYFTFFLYPVLIVTGDSNRGEHLFIY